MPLQTSALGERKPRLAQHTQPRRDATGTRGAHIQQYKGGTPGRAEAAPRTARTTTPRRAGHAARIPQYKACFTHARSTRLHSHTNAGPGRDTPLPQASLGSLGPLAPAQPAAQAHATRDAAYKTRLGYTFAIRSRRGARHQRRPRRRQGRWRDKQVRWESGSRASVSTHNHGRRLEVRGRVPAV